MSTNSTLPSVTAPLSILTVTVKPLTTTFTPPASCAEMRLTQLSSPGYQLWLNEPQPVPSSKFGECYPPGFVEGYTSLFQESSSIAPLFSPLVCQSGWNTVMDRPNGYIACCASGFLLHPPESPADTNRPAYGGTCYSNFQAGQTVRVTAYDSASVTATVIWTAAASTDQAYAHPIDGFRIQQSTSTSSSSPPSSPASQLPLGDPSPQPSTDDDASSGGSEISGGQIAGIVVGTVGALALVLAAVAFVFRRQRRKRNQALPPQPPPAGGDSDDKSPPPQQQYVALQPWGAKAGAEEGATPSPAYAYSPGASDAGTLAARYELSSVGVGELDGGWRGRELS
ncbi:hypothetical protein GGS23DRAFT_580373 [Durotheca rogersii]|uniref:uncharacterized protein n=1 Tax=Durotheca rogersii TaxID=419775 RepID=UPI00221F67E4|nr:uncharacterized protein GGS23DRAFT_580373 [Durotheca rogersii]KAI5860496.1 hypothetical protein GGS23DRAFT_580373 [Durotheca rogersii]